MVEQQYQTFGRRVGAYLLDRLPFFALEQTSGLLYGYVGSVYFGLAYGQFLTWAWIAYRVLLHGFWGQTVGKKMCKVRVVDLSGRPLSMKQAFLREIVLIILDLAYALYLIFNLDAYTRAATGGELGSRLTTANTVYLAAVTIWWLAQIVTIRLNDRQRAIHDYIAGSVVLRLDVQEVPPEAEMGGHSRPNGFANLGRPRMAAIGAVMAALTTLILPTLFIMDGELCPGYSVDVAAYYGKMAPLTIGAAILGAILGSVIDWPAHLGAENEGRGWRLGCIVLAIIIGGLGLAMISALVAVFPGC
jgi:uncharacterized RDD family membrane protein YckC